MRHKRVIVLAVALAALAGLVAIGTLGGADKPPGERRGATTRTEAAAPSATGKKPRGRAPAPAGTAPASGGGAGGEGVRAWNVYAVAAGGGRPRVLARTESEAPVPPGWAPDRDLIAYPRPSCEECDSGIWAIRGDGSAPRRISSGPGNATDPVWAPGGRRLAAVRVGGGLYVVDPDTGASRQLARAGRVVDDAAWSPTGRSIAFTRRVGTSDWDIFSVDPAGRRVRRLTRGGPQEVAPSWSPDGRRVAYQRQESNGGWAIWSMHADGSGRRRLVPGSPRSSSEQPAWSPDGHRIAFVVVTLRNSRIAVAPIAGGRPAVITARSLQASDPGWSPDAGRVAFTARAAGG